MDIEKNLKNIRVAGCLGIIACIITSNASLEWLATTFFAAAMIYVTINLISDALTATMALHTDSGKIDPSVIRTLNESTLLLFGSVAEILVVTMMIVAGIMLYSTKVLPVLTGFLAFLTAIVNLIFVPSMFFGSNFENFYSAAGDGPAAVAPLFFIIWIFTTAISMLRKK